MKVSAGFTLVELMVVLTIIAVLLSLGVPSYRYVTNSNRISAEVNALLGDLQFARSEAVKEGGTVIVCPANTALSACTNSSTWNNGWLVISNTTGNPVVLRVQAPFANTKDSFVSADGQTTEISFNRNGFASAMPALANGSVTIKLTTTPNVSQWQRCVEVVMGGAITTEKYNQDACT
ncbi:MAG: GspH/FimT family pseudopilin [Sinobacteraceae bacterium]|nr:GspH/FimT family pseudopilin [Nevskiaceae bacterium]